MKVLIDSGSTINVISETTIKKLNTEIQILPFKKKVYAFNAKEPLGVTGCIWATVKSENHSLSAKFIIVPQSNMTILGYETASALNLLRVGPIKETVN